MGSEPGILDRLQNAAFDMGVVGSGAAIGAALGYALGSEGGLAGLRLPFLGTAGIGTALGAGLGGGMAMTLFSLVNTNRVLALDLDAKTAVTSGGLMWLFHAADGLGQYVPFLFGADRSLPGAVTSGFVSGSIAGFLLK